jgi:hypothetical protein
MSNEEVQRNKTCVDDLPHDVKPIIIGAIDLCAKVDTFIRSVMQKDVSDKQAVSNAYDAHVSACKLYHHLHKVFGWEDISKILEDLNIGDEEEDMIVIGVKKGESNG